MRVKQQPELQPGAGPLSGRLILLIAAYSPVVIIAGLRGVPTTAGWISLGVGLFGVCLWTLFLLWLPQRQPRDVKIDAIEPMDTEVTGYIVSLLLPVIAASRPRLNDWIAYGVCAVLVLVVAFAARLWAVNPITYLFRLRPALLTINGRAEVALVHTCLVDTTNRQVVRRLGVLLLLPMGTD